MPPRVLVLTDIVDSTRLAERLGHERAVALWAEHDRRARDLMARHGAREIERTDGFIMLFDRMPEAAAFASVGLAVIPLAAGPRPRPRAARRAPSPSAR